MATAKVHPCAAYGWLYLNPADAQEASRVKLEHRDRQLEQDRHASGEPPTFAAWAHQQVARLAARQPKIRDQIAQRREHLQEQLRRTQTELLTAVEQIESRGLALEQEYDRLGQLLEAEP